jgi:hypothetical protein
VVMLARQRILHFHRVCQHIWEAEAGIATHFIGPQTSAEKHG